jgi:hypothetical protein
VEFNRGAVAGWAGGVCGGAAALAAVFATFTGEGWRIAVFVLAGIAGLALIMLIGIAFQPASQWRREMRRQRKLRREPPKPVTDRWQYTLAAFDVGTLANLGHKAFSHHSYTRPGETKAPAVRVGVFVACSPLADDQPTADRLRLLMRDWLGQPELMEFIGKLTGLYPDASWHSQPGRGRFVLEADLVGPSGKDRVLASALLLLPERGVTQYGKDPAGAELYVHVTLPAKDGVPVKAGIAEWHSRFTAALSIPRLLAEFLPSAGLVPAGDPAARFAMQLQARPDAATGLDEIVDFDGLAVLSPRRYAMQFDGWAVADQLGKTAEAVSRRLVTELCECTGRTGYEGVLAKLAAGEQRGAVPRAASGRGGRVSRVALAAIAGTAALALAGGGVAAWAAFGRHKVVDRPPVPTATTTAKAPGSPTPTRSFVTPTGPTPVATLPAPKGGGHVAVAFGGKGTLLAVGSGRRTDLWTVPASGQRASQATTPFVDPHSLVSSVAVSSDGDFLATGDYSGTTWLWTVGSGLGTRLPDKGGYSVDCVAFSPDGKYLAVGDSNGAVYLWSVAAPHTSYQVKDSDISAVESVAFSAKSRKLAVGYSDGTTYLFTLSNGKETGYESFTDPGGQGVNSVALSPDGNWLVAGDADGTVFLWNIESQNHRDFVDQESSNAQGVAFSADSRFFYSVDANGATYVWKVADYYQKGAGTPVTTPSVTLYGPNGIEQLSIAYRSEDPLLAVGDAAGTVELWPAKWLGS